MATTNTNDYKYQVVIYFVSGGEARLGKYKTLNGALRGQRRVQHDKTLGDLARPNRPHARAWWVVIEEI